jgi:hypothetical protein
MKNPVQKMAIAGLVTTKIFAVAMFVHTSGQQQPQVTAEFRNANTAEVCDAQGRCCCVARSLRSMPTTTTRLSAWRSWRAGSCRGHARPRRPGRG